jgi:hypothetical protein
MLILKRPPEDELIKRLNELLDFLIANASSTKDFVLSQSPHIIQEIVTYGRVSNTIYVVVSFIIFITSLVLFVLSFRKLVNASTDAQFLPAAAFFTLGIGSGVGILYHIRDFIIAWTAPRLYMLNYICELIRRY